MSEIAGAIEIIDLLEDNHQESLLEPKPLPLLLPDIRKRLHEIGQGERSGVGAIQHRLLNVRGQ